MSRKLPCDFRCRAAWVQCMVVHNPHTS